jgi:predicted RNA-binding Zn-ribbon protein involved in translation (DUF1610 family)
MPRISCRCGESLSVPADGPERVVCPKCGAKIRVRRPGAPAGPGDGDGFVRFTCPCGRRLKVRAEEGKGFPESGKCPDCGRVVPVPAASTLPASSPALPTSHPEAVTEELSAADLTALEQWKQRHQGVVVAARAAEVDSQASTTTMPVPVVPATGGKMEAGLRVCPRCGKPVHLNSIVCRACGAHVPKR